MLRCCIEPPAGHILPSIGSYVGITLEIRTAVFMWQYFLLLQKLVNDFLFPASKQVKEARDHPGGLMYILLYWLNTPIVCMECHFVSDWGKSDTSMVYEEM